MRALGALVLLSLLLMAARPVAASAALQVLSETADGLLLELELPAPQLAQVEIDGRIWDQLRQTGFAREVRSGHPDLPFLARLVAAPPGARLAVEVVDAEWVEQQEVELIPVPAVPPDASDPPTYAPNPEAYAQNLFLPAESVLSTYSGVLRGTTAHALRIYPFQYNPARQILRACTRLRVRIRFAGGRRPRSALRSAAAREAPLFDAFLNPAQAATWSSHDRAPKTTAVDWYDLALPWIKVHVDEDGLYCIDPDWLKRYVDPAEIDPRTFRLFYLGEELALLARGQEDGRFDAPDCLIFPGRLRRDNRDFGSLYGPRNTYWLTWGGTPGKRFAERSGAPLDGYPEERSFWTTVHAEVDKEYDPLLDVPDIERDHWFWQLVKGTHPTKPGSGVYPGILQYPDLDQDYVARVRVALHGGTNLAHHTVAKLSTGHIIADSIWGVRREGQIELLVDSEVPSTALRDSINRVVVQVYADQEKFDWVYMNWFEIDYRRRYRTADGYLEFLQSPSSGHRISIAGLRDTRVELLDVVRGIRFTDLQIDSTQGEVRATFEDRSPAETRYVIADRQALKRPRGELDTLTAWRHSDNRADYLIIAHPSLLRQARQLADHRRASGLEVEIASTKDLYDEFTHGRVDRRAIADFIRYAYHQWTRRPAYVLLLGDDTYDYRRILGGVPAFVPAPYYQSRGRGEAPSDFLYTLVDGDDLLPDLALGRLAASNGGEAEQAVAKIIRYDREPESGDWRSRVIYLANYHPQNTFTDPNDSLAARYTEPWGLTSVKVYNPDESPFPNVTGRAFLDAINDGAVLLNFNGHGSAGTIQFVFSLASSILNEWDYLSLVRNGGRLPLMLALSCLNGMFVNPQEESVGEVFTTMEGGAIAYISASAKSFPSQNDLLSDFMYERFFEHQELAFGPVLNAAKSQILAAHPEIGSGWEEVALTMQLFGDPAQELALPHHPDYAAHDLRLADEEVFGHATVQVEAQLRNSGRRTADSLQTVVLGYAAGTPLPDTLFAAVLPPLTAPADLSFTWTTGPRRGPYHLELRVDPEDRIAELDEQNNLLTLDLEILEPLSAEPVFPAPGATIGPEELRLQAAVPLEGGPFSCEFSLSTEPDFPAASTLVSAPIPAVDGAAAYPLDVIDPELSLYWRSYFWKVRLHSPGAVSSWSPLRTFRFSPTAESPTWHQEGIQLHAAVSDSLVLEEGGLTLSPEPLPFRPSSATREDGFTVLGLAGAGVLCTDGTLVYAKRWYNDNSTVYPGDDFFTHVGTGSGDYHRTGHYGQLADSTTAGISATYHSDGYIYSESGHAFELERLSVATGALDTVAVHLGLLEWKSGQVEDGHSLITSDGRFIYNVSMSSQKGARTEWGVRVFDPARNWALVREFTSPPTENGFTFQWTDGILADGRRLYLIEYGGQRRIRMIDAFDGRFLDEWTSDQDTTRIISGQYDWINNKVWLGDLLGSAVFRYTGMGYVDSAAALSAPIGPAARWERLQLDGEATDSGHLQADLLVRRADRWAAHPDFVGLSPGTAIDLSRLDAGAYPQIRLRARLRGGHQNTRLRSWSVDFAPRPSLRLSRAEGKRAGTGLGIDLQVRNLSSFAVSDAFVRLERSDQNLLLREHPLAPLAPGETRQVHLDSLDIPPPGVRLFAQVKSGQPDAQPADDRQEVLLLFGGRAPLAFASWPDGHAFLSGDPLRPGQALIVAAPGVPGGRLELTADGDPAMPDSTLDPFPDIGPRLLYRPQLPAGRHLLQARLVRDGEELGLRELVFQLGDELTLANPLIYPHPVRDQTAFTYVLSHDAEVRVEIFALSGRLVRRLGPEPQTAGFRQLAWDVRDADGRRLANGAYLYLLHARRGAEEAIHRGPLAIVR